MRTPEHQRRHRAAAQPGYDANKKLKGRRRHVAVDTDGQDAVIKLALRAFDVKFKPKMTINSGELF